MLHFVCMCVYICVCTYMCAHTYIHISPPSFFTHSSIGGHLHHFHVLAIINNATIVTKSKLALLAAWETNKSRRWDVEARNMTSFSHLPHIWSTKEPCIQALTRWSYWDISLPSSRSPSFPNKVKRPFYSCKYLLEWQDSGRGGVLISFFYNLQVQKSYEQRHFSLTGREGQGSLRWAIMLMITKGASLWLRWLRICLQCSRNKG